MKNIVKKIVATFLVTTILLCNFQNVSSVFAYENSILSTGYVDVSTTAVKELSVRSNPTTSSTKIGSIKHKDTVKIIDSVVTITKDKYNNNVLTDPWYKISFNNSFGYVSANYVKLNGEDSTYIPSNKNPLKGIDISYHQNDIDWQKVKNSGVQFAIIRGGSGTTIDSKFETNIKNALDAGIDVGVYWFSTAYTANSAKAEADKCMEVVAPYKNKLSFPIFFDYEEHTIKSAQNNNIVLSLSSVSNICETFLSRLKANGYKTGLYTNKAVSKFYLSDKLRNSNDIWIAQYGNRCNYFGKYVMWQYSQSGKVGGIKGNVDLNYYYKNNSLNISNATINAINNQKYTGKKITPKITVKYNNKTLIKDTDYTVSFKNNTSIGIASVTITGRGNYTGSKTITFKIVPKTVTNLKLANSKSNSVKLTWSKVSNSSGYEIYRANSKNGTFSKIKDITKNSTLSYTNSKLTKKKTYFYKVRAYKTVNNKKIYGSFSSIKSITVK